MFAQGMGLVEKSEALAVGFRSTVESGETHETKP
jgi:hypothetical protein